MIHTPVECLDKKNANVFVVGSNPATPDYIRNTSPVRANSSQSKKTVKILAFGGALAEFNLISREVNISEEISLDFDVVNPFLSEGTILRIKAFCEGKGWNVSFLDTDDIYLDDFLEYDIIICLSTAFRMNSEEAFMLANDNIVKDKSLPILADENGGCEFIIQLKNLLRFFLSKLKVRGIAIIFPATISFDCVGIDSDVVEVLDPQPMVSFVNAPWVDTPLFLNSHIAFHRAATLFVKGREEAIFRVWASELQKEVDLRQVSPRMLAELGHEMVPTRFSFACIGRKIKEYRVRLTPEELEGLKKPFQLDTQNRPPMEYTENLSDTQRKILEKVESGARYKRDYPLIVTTLQDQFDQL